MAIVTAVWGIDIGQCALKALRLQLTAEGAVEVTHFDIIEHPKILSQPDAETDQLIQNALDKFLSRNEIGKARVALSVPGQSSFARFVKLPPVEPKRIPEIVKFEAVQQIPFDIEEVEWDYQTFVSEKSPEVEVGIFAMRKELVVKHLSYLRAAGVEADIVQLAPLALYNMMIYDGLVSKQGATILIDVGAENTDLVISDSDRIWLRSIPLGGNNFTESLIKAFKLPFSKAESLKRTAATNKYARQIFVAMRPVFGDLTSEVQRSIGFYTSLHRDAQITRVLCLGNAFRLPGLQKYLEQTLQLEAVRPNSFARLKSSPTVNAPAFAENLWSFGVAYGLGVQALELAPISSNLLPFSIARQRNWHSQRPWFAAAAAAMVLGVGLASWSAFNRKAHAARQQDAGNRVAQPELRAAATIQATKDKLRRQGEQEKEEIRDIHRISDYSDIIAQLWYLVQDSVPDDWRTKAAEAVARDQNKNVEELDFRRHVWARVGTNEFQKNTANKIHLLLIDSVQTSLWQGKPPVVTRVDRVDAFQPPGGMPPGGMPPGGGGMPPGEGFQPPPGPMAPAYPNVPSGEDSGGARAQKGSGDTTATYLRVTIVGYTNAALDLRGDELTPYLQRFLDAINNQAASNRALDRIRLPERLNINQSLHEIRQVAQPPKCWPPIKEAVSADGPAAEGRPPAAGQAAATADYPINCFTLVFDAQVITPTAPAAPPARPVGGRPR